MRLPCSQMQPLLFLSQALSGRAHQARRRPRPPRPPRSISSRPRGRQLHPGLSHANHAPARLPPDRRQNRQPPALRPANRTLNLRRLTIEPNHIEDVVIDRRTIEETCIGCDQWSEEDFPAAEETEEEKAAAAAGKLPTRPSRAAARAKARHNEALEAEADRLIRQGDPTYVDEPPTPSQPPDAIFPPIGAPRVGTARVETGTIPARVGTGTLARPVERSSTGTATKPARPKYSSNSASPSPSRQKATRRQPQTISRRSKLPSSLREAQPEKRTQESRPGQSKKRNPRHGPRLDHEDSQTRRPASVKVATVSLWRGRPRPRARATELSVRSQAQEFSSQAREMLGLADVGHFVARGFGANDCY